MAMIAYLYIESVLVENVNLNTSQSSYLELYFVLVKKNFTCVLVFPSSQSTKSGEKPRTKRKPQNIGKGNDKLSHIEICPCGFEAKAATSNVIHKSVL